MLAVPSRKKASREEPSSMAKSDPSKLIDQKIVDLADWRGEMIAKLRKVIHDVDPEVVEEWKWMGTPTWSHDGILLIINAHKDKVKLTFSEGARLPDPEKLFNSMLGGNKWRAIDFFEGDKINDRAVKNLVRAAIALNIRHKVLRAEK
jgi:hypothetical protein